MSTDETPDPVPPSASPAPPVLPGQYVGPAPVADVTDPVTQPGYPAGYAPGNFAGYSSYPGYPGWGGYPYPMVQMVPRPPRPRTISIAVLLCWIGIAVSGVATIAGLVVDIIYRDELVREALAQQNPTAGAQVEDMASLVTTLTLALSVAFWLLVAAGVAVCAVFTGRGRNPARILLAALTGIIAFANLLCTPLTVVATGAGAFGTTQSFDIGPPAYDVVQMVSLVLNVLLGLVAAVIFVLVLLRASITYCSPGPGRSFVA
jgi:hypothetical protein